MAYSVTNPIAGSQNIADTSTTQNHPLGTIVQAKDATFGEGEFIYLLGVASTAVGDVVVWDGVTYQTTRAAVTTLQGRSVGVAMSANVASQYGWYQIGGTAVVNKSAVVIGNSVKIGINSTAKIGVSASGKEILNARSANSTVSATATARVTLNRPFLQGRIT